MKLFRKHWKLILISALSPICCLKLLSIEIGSFSVSAVDAAAVRISLNLMSEGEEPLDPATVQRYEDFFERNAKLQRKMEERR